MHGGHLPRTSTRSERNQSSSANLSLSSFAGGGGVLTDATQL